MANTPKKVAVIGLDCAMPHMIEHHIAEGKLPTFKKLIGDGTLAENCLAPFPTVTPPNWACIGTGAWDGTHGITDFHVHKPGTSPTNENTVQAFSSERVKAEYIWDAADKAGKKCIVLNYPGSSPSKMKNGIMVGGAGMSANEFRDGLPKLSARISMCADQLVTNGVYPGAIKGKLESAEGWKNIPAGDDPLEMKFNLLFPAAKEKPENTTWYVLAHQSGGQGYDRLTLSPTKDFKEAFCTLGPGQWSPKISTCIKMAGGSEREVVFRCKLIELTDDAEDFRLLIGSIGETSGWSMPSDVAKKLVSVEGTFAPQGGIFGLSVGWFDLDTYVEINEQYAQWLGDAATILLGSYEWDLFFMHFHPTDWIYHIIMNEMDPALNPDAAKREKAWAAHLRIYEAADRMIAQILKVCDKDTMIVLVSDHGAVADGTPFNPYDVLVPAGLTQLQEQKSGAQPKSKTQAVTERVVGKGAGSALLVPELNKSKALPQRELYIYVNLKGRDPGGIVEPKDYEKVQQQIIDSMLCYVDPQTGKRPVAMALSKQDARILGLYSDGIGDVVYALYPWFGGQHGPILPTAEWGIGSLKALLVMAGPGIKKGHRLERTVWLPDLVPTICYLLDLPVPAQTEGAIIYQAFKDPDFKTKEINKLKDGLSRMETALQRGERQPWDKHECA